MKRVVVIIVMVLFVSCKKEAPKKKIIITKAPIQKQSEMAALMLQMYAHNAANKEQILAGKAPKEFPEEFLKIHTAELTDPSNRKPEFATFSNFYLENLKKVFEPSNEALKTRHNNVVNSCITCHQTTCLGPIPKIKKLLIR